jgi:hypothetical protein
MGTRKTPAPPGRVAEGDRVRIDRIKPYDRKPGLAGVGFTYDNPDRMLPVKRAGHLRVLHLAARSESPPSRFFAVLRILIFIASVGLGAILFLIKPYRDGGVLRLLSGRRSTDNVSRSARSEPFLIL